MLSSTVCRLDVIMRTMIKLLFQFTSLSKRRPKGHAIVMFKPCMMIIMCLILFFGCVTGILFWLKTSCVRVVDCGEFGLLSNL